MIQIYHFSQVSHFHVHHQQGSVFGHTSLHCQMCFPPCILNHLDSSWEQLSVTKLEDGFIYKTCKLYTEEKQFLIPVKASKPGQCEPGRALSAASWDHTDLTPEICDSFSSFFFCSVGNLLSPSCLQGVRNVLTQPDEENTQPMSSYVLFFFFFTERGFFAYRYQRVITEKA